jgi:hypothetical protein
VLVSMKLGWTGGRWLRAPGPIHCSAGRPAISTRTEARNVDKREGD